MTTRHAQNWAVFPQHTDRPQRGLLLSSGNLQCPQYGCRGLRGVAGLGNIYTDEALWWARIHPLRPAASLERDEVRHLHRAIRRALERGIKRQGADLGDGVYRGGRLQKEFKVYGRVDEPCDRCGTPIAKTRVGGRGTWFCPTCQAAST